MLPSPLNSGTVLFRIIIFTLPLQLLFQLESHSLYSSRKSRVFGSCCSKSVAHVEPQVRYVVQCLWDSLRCACYFKPLRLLPYQ